MEVLFVSFTVKWNKNFLKLEKEEQTIPKVNRRKEVMIIIKNK